MPSLVTMIDLGGRSVFAKRAQSALRGNSFVDFLFSDVVAANQPVISQCAKPLFPVFLSDIEVARSTIRIGNDVPVVALASSEIYNWLPLFTGAALALAINNVSWSVAALVPKIAFEDSGSIEMLVGEIAATALAFWWVRLLGH